MKTFQFYVIFLLYFTTFFPALAQKSKNTVSFQITFNKETKIYTVWVVPNYNVPNEYNTTATEKGATAQVTIAVPKNVHILNIKDITGVWEKAPFKLGPGQPGQVWNGLDKTKNYYVLGKTSQETDYGIFVKDKPVGLFTFQTNICDGDVSIITDNHPFIAEADKQYSLNVANSFYTRSGQPVGGNQVPLEQFSSNKESVASCAYKLVANPDNYFMNANTIINSTVLSNDSLDFKPAQINQIQFSIKKNPSNGNIAVNASGVVQYTPNKDFVGIDSYLYEVCERENQFNCDTALVTILVMTDKTVLMAINDNNITTKNAVVKGNLLLNDLLARGSGNLVATLLPKQNPAHGTVTIEPNGVYTYQPNKDFVGTDSFKYEVCSSASSTLCGIAEVNIEISNSQVNNIPPRAVADQATGKIDSYIKGNVMINDSDDSGFMTATLLSVPKNGLIVFTIKGDYLYFPNKGFSGTDFFNYKVCDAGKPQLCNESVVFLDVTN